MMGLGLGLGRPAEPFSSAPWPRSFPSLDLSLSRYKRGRLALPRATCLTQSLLGELDSN